MDITAKVSTRGQVTIPKKVRDAIGIAAGDEVVFRIDEPRAVLARAEHLLTMDAVPAVLPPTKRKVPWDAARRPAPRLGAKKQEAGAGRVRGTEVPSLTINLAEESRKPTRR
jgi:AbrB family looped-hinge helix DNA binding protein